MRLRSRRPPQPTPLPGSARELCCSFCGEVQGRVNKLIGGPGVYICDRCVRLCVEIIESNEPCRR